MEVRMKKIVNLIIYAAIISLSFSAWAAEKMKQPTVEYSADMVIESGGVSSTGKVYHGLGGKDRWEMNAQGAKAITISRTDKKVAWILMPEQKMYMEMGIEESAKNTQGTNVNDCEMDFSSLGDENVNGVKATKNRVSGSCPPDDVDYEGTMWITKDNIVVKMASVTTVDGKRTNITMDLKNLDIGKQDASLFEIPAGYQKFSMGNFSSMFNAAQSQASQAQEQAAREQAARDQETGDEPDTYYTGRDYTGRAYTSAASSSSQISDEADAYYTGRAYTAASSSTGSNPIQGVGDAADKTNETLDTTDKVKNTVDRLKGLFGR